MFWLVRYAWMEDGFVVIQRDCEIMNEEWGGLNEWKK